MALNRGGGQEFLKISKRKTKSENLIKNKKQLIPKYTIEIFLVLRQRTALL